MAKEADDKLRIAERLYDFACNQHGLPPSDLLFDPLTFTICTGNEDDRKLGLKTLDAIAAIRERMPECQIILGLSNISFGLNPPARQVLNSVFLDHALKRGLTGAIVHFSKILPLHRIPEEEVRIAEDLIFDRRADGYDPLQAFIALFEGAPSRRPRRRAGPRSSKSGWRSASSTATGSASKPISTWRCRSTSRSTSSTTILLDGMKTVGELFGAGKMQLPVRAAIGRDDEGGGRAISNRSWSGSRARRRARSCSPRCAATCTTSARTSSTSS